MPEGLSAISNFFRIPITLIRLEICFAAFFCFFFSFFIGTISTLEFTMLYGFVLSSLFLIIGIISFLPFFSQQYVRILSNITYLLAFILIFYVVYVNRFSIEAFYLLFINYGLYIYSLSSFKACVRLNITIWLLTLIVIYLLDFETEVSIYFICFFYFILGLGGLIITNSKSHYKKKNRERSQHLNIVLNNSSNAQLLLEGEDLILINANQKAHDLLDLGELKKNQIVNVKDLKIKGESVFKNIDKGESKTIELIDKRLLKIVFKEIIDQKKIFYFIEIEEFKDRIESSETLEFEKLKSINDQSYESLFKDNPALICILNKDGKIIDINDTYLTFLQYLKSEIVGRKHSIFDFKDYTNERKIINQKAWQGETQLFEKEIVSKEGNVLFIEVILRKAKYFGEDVLISNCRDISQRKMLEKIADYNHLQYSSLFKESPIGLFISDLDGDIVETNESFQKLLGYKKEEFLGRNINYFHATKPSISEEELWENLLNGSRPFIEVEKVYKRKDGQIIYSLLKLNIQKDEDNIPAKLLGQVINISNFIKSEKSLQVSLKSYKDIFNTSFELRYILDTNNTFIDVNNSVEKEYGYDRSEIIGKAPDFLGELEKMDFPAILQKLELSWKGQDQEVLWWSKRKDNSTFPKRLHIRKGIYFGQEVLVCSGQNVQKNLDYERQILRSEKKYRNLINKTIVGIIIFRDKKVVFANERALDILKYNSISEIIGLNQYKILKFDQPNLQNDRETAIFSGKKVPLLEFELIDVNGNSVFVESIPTKIDFEGEECILESFVEITDRKKIEAVKKEVREQKVDNDSLRIQLEQNRIIQRRLQNSQSYSEGIIESSLDMIFTTDTEGKIDKINSAAKSQFQYERVDVIRKPFGLLLKDKELEKEIIEKLNISNSYSGEIRMKRKDGSTFPALLSISQFFNTEGTFLGIMGISRDITEMVSKEQEIKKQASKLTAIIESSSHYFFTVNKNYRFTSFNQLFKDDIRYNYNVDLELFDDFFSLVKIAQKRNKVEEEYWKNIFDRAFSGESVEFEVDRKNVNGVGYYREMYINPIVGERGVINEVSGIGHDITQKKLNEIELTNSLKEKEILLKEVHHRVKNNMQVISSILSLQSSYVTDDHVLEVLKESRNRIDAMASIHERLYRTTNLSDIRFSSYVKDLVESLVNTYELLDTSVELVFSLDEVFLSLNHAIPCGLILNELISNSLKYAFKGQKKGKIEITLISKLGKISLSLADDGVGIPEGINAQTTDTLGLQLVSTLVEQMEGTLYLDRQDGTKFIISFDTKPEV